MMNRIAIDPAQCLGEVSRSWQKCIGSAHAAMALRADWQEQMRRCYQDLGFEYVRFHGWFCDDMHVCSQVGDRLQISWSNVDRVCQTLIEIGIKPLIELSFMPKALASGPQTVFHYQANVTPPKDWQAWEDLVSQFASHLLERFGLERVSQWPFEVWNEPNWPAFWTGSQEDYFELYRRSARAIKSVHSDLQVGGPSTAKNEWIVPFRQFCESAAVPYDFVSTHHYPTDSALGLADDMQGQLAASERGVTLAMCQKARQEAGDKPLYYTEWNSTPSCRDPYHDEPFAAAFIAKSVMDNGPWVDMYSYWTFSDIFEEVPMPSEEFHGGFGLLTMNGIAKPSYRAFELLKRFQGELLLCSKPSSPTLDVWAARKGDKVFVLLVNQQMPGSSIEQERVHLEFKEGLRFSNKTLWLIDSMHANPKQEWLKMGSPAFLDSEAKARLIEASCLQKQTLETLEFSMAPQSVALIEL